MGGPIASILRFKEVTGVNLDEDYSHKDYKHLLARTMDLKYLRKQEFLTAKVYGSKLNYRFMIDKEEYVFELPNTEFTSLNNRGNIEFLPLKEDLTPFSSLEVLYPPSSDDESPPSPVAQKKKATSSTKKKGKSPLTSTLMSQEQLGIMEDNLMDRISHLMEDNFKEEWKAKIVKKLTPIVTKELLPKIIDQVTTSLTTSITASITSSLSADFVETLTPTLLDKLTPEISGRVEKHIATQMKKARLERAQAEKRPPPPSTTTPPDRPQKQARNQAPTGEATIPTPAAPAKEKASSTTSAKAA